MTDSELDSCGEVSSDSGEYRDLPIIVETGDIKNIDQTDEQGQDQPFENEFQNYTDR